MKNYMRNTNQNHYSLAKIIHHICLLTLMIMLVTGCSNEKDKVLQQKVDDLTSNYEELQEEYNQLKGEHEILQTDYESLQSEYESLQTEIEGYQDQQATIDDLNAKLTELQSQYDALQAERDSLTSQIASLQSSQTNSNPQVAPSPQANNNGDMVWLSETGSKYHSINNCGRMNPNKARQVSQSSAEGSGYGRCEKCF